MMERSVIKGLIVFMLFWVSRAIAVPVSSDYAAVPPLLNKTSAPLVMLVMSVDHELFKKAYSDFTDLDVDGRLDTSYKDNFDYLGYFDSNWCYQYSSDRYIPVSQSTGANSHYCTSSSAPWSGNFLNWATMARIDILRKVLHGGKRSTDTASQTILERAYIPKDVHAFVKVYAGSDIASLTPYNDVVSLCSVSQSEYGNPVVRIANGSASGKTGWPRWGSTEVSQCQWSSSDDNSPASVYQLAEHAVRIESCVSGKDAASRHCREYPNGNSKPVGLLQKYGEDGTIQFGLLSGSYDKNISGGILRRNIGKIGGNANSSNDEIDLTTGRFNSLQGIIHNINAFRLAKYNFSQSKYTDCNEFGISVSSFKSNRGTSSSRHCSMWGNPLAEIYLEALRYFAGETTPTYVFDSTNDNQFVSDLSRENWSNPMDSNSACSNCSIILLSTGLNSFDTDELSSSADLPGLTGAESVNTKTDQVGNLEYGGNFAGNYLVGGTGSTRQCTDKYLSGLSQAVGLCPEIPQLEGGYQLSGLSLYANTSDLRTNFTGKQNVRTYAIEFAESMPSFTLNVNGKSVTFQPVCQSSSNFGSGTDFSGSGSDCTLTNVEVKDSDLVYDASGSIIEGSLLFTWEDSLWGNDYDYDASSRIKFCIGNQCNQTGDTDLKTTGYTANELRIAVQVDGVYAGLNMRFSYTVTGVGTGNDGLQTDYAYKEANSANYPAAFNVHPYVASGTAAGILPKPMLLAAKYGGFTDLDNDGTPNNRNAGQGNTLEWDNRNNLTSALGADGLPDNYFFSRNPALLEAQLNQVLSDISSRVSSATNAALFANSSNGTGALYQALFQPKFEANGKTVQWGGLLHALFVDSKGHLREDGNGNDKLDDYSTDKIVELFFDPNAGQTMVQRYTSPDEGITRELTGGLSALSSLATIWDGRQQLANITGAASQRSFNASASNGRHILTWMDQDNDGLVDASEFLPFVPDSFSGKEGYLATSSAEVGTLVNYVRGVEQTGYRNRTVDFDDDGDNEVWRLGDVVNSTPTLVSAPASRYDSFYSDTSYQTFREQYINRRHVLYIGANDGLIHAFNGGFWNESDHSYQLTGDNTEVQHPLGSELWAYAPMNLLPHLQWLKELDYPHVYFVDGEPLVFDANIFTEDDDHPGGWGTVLVVGMRLGGGDFEVTVGDNTKIMRSAYVVMDITNPEKPPQLLAEISHPDLGFTTSHPQLIKKRIAGAASDGSQDWNNPSTNEWYLAFGSGPGGSGSTATRDALDDGKSDQNMRLFMYDLSSKSFVSGFNPLITSYPESYAGDLSVKDWDEDYQDDAVYFGMVDTASTLGGRIMRLRLQNDINSSTLGVLLDSGLPSIARPLAIADKNSYWVYSGTGRLLTTDDNRSTTGNYFYGIQEPLDSSGNLTFASVNPAHLIDTSNVEVLTNGDVRVLENGSYEGVSVGSSTVTTFDNLKSAVKAEAGWKRALNYDGNNPSGRNINDAIRLFSLILFSEYEPPADSCSVDGNSFLYGLHYLTGTATPNEVLGSVVVPDLENVKQSLDRVTLGVGYASSPVVHQGEASRLSAVTQGAGGSISSVELNYQFNSEGRQTWWQIFNIPWVD